MHSLWLAVDQEGGFLESYATKTCDKEARLAFIYKARKWRGWVSNHHH
jgi:transposase-like protein